MRLAYPRLSATARWPTLKSCRMKALGSEVPIAHAFAPLRLRDHLSSLSDWCGSANRQVVCRPSPYSPAESAVTHRLRSSPLAQRRDLERSTPSPANRKRSKHRFDLGFPTGNESDIAWLPTARDFEFAPSARRGRMTVVITVQCLSRLSVSGVQPPKEFVPSINVRRADSERSPSAF